MPLPLKALNRRALRTVKVVSLIKTVSLLSPHKHRISISSLKILVKNLQGRLELQKQFEEAQAAYEVGQAVMASLSAQYDDIISWADMYDAASMETKKMIVNCLIKRVEVCRDYKLHIDFNIDFDQFSLGMDIVKIAA